MQIIKRNCEELEITLMVTDLFHWFTKLVNPFLKNWFYSTFGVIHFFHKTNISYSLISARTWAYQGVKNVKFYKNVTHILNGSPLLEIFITYPFREVAPSIYCSVYGVPLVSLALQSLSEERSNHCHEQQAKILKLKITGSKKH